MKIAAEVAVILARSPQDLEEAGGALPWSLGGSGALPTPSFGTSDLQNHEGINSCCLKPPLHGDLLWQLQET